MFQHTAARRRLLNIPVKRQASFMFQHTAARRRLHRKIDKCAQEDEFQHTAARRRLPFSAVFSNINGLFQHTAARRRLLLQHFIFSFLHKVSTHSRPKAAADALLRSLHLTHCFNTQPPEGGCKHVQSMLLIQGEFQHTAARRRLPAPTKSTFL